MAHREAQQKLLEASGQVQMLGRQKKEKVGTTAELEGAIARLAYSQEEIQLAELKEKQAVRFPPLPLLFSPELS